MHSEVNCKWRYGRYGCRLGLFGGRPSDGVCVLICKKCEGPHDETHPAIAHCFKISAPSYVIVRKRACVECPAFVTIGQKCGQRSMCSALGPVSDETIREYHELLHDPDARCPGLPARWIEVATTPDPTTANTRKCSGNGSLNGEKKI